MCTGCVGAGRACLGSPFDFDSPFEGFNVGRTDLEAWTRWREMWVFGAAITIKLTHNSHSPLFFPARADRKLKMTIKDGKPRATMTVLP